MNDLIMFDFQHFYQRIAKELPNNARLAEVGIANGDSVIYLAQELKNLGKDFKIYAIDNMGYGGFFQMKTIYENIIKSGLGDYIEVMPYASLDCAKMFNDGFLDFVYIDSSHTYKETKQEVIEWYNKVKDEGILAGHDFNADEVVAKALTLGTTDLEAVFKQITFDRVYSKATETSKKLDETEGRKAAKRQASIVSSAKILLTISDSKMST